MCDQNERTFDPILMWLKRFPTTIANIFSIT